MKHKELLKIIQGNKEFKPIYQKWVDVKIPYTWMAELIEILWQQKRNSTT